jgi:hypothetical protein
MMNYETINRHCERSEAIHWHREFGGNGLLRRFAPLRKRFALSQAMTKTTDRI